MRQYSLSFDEPASQAPSSSTDAEHIVQALNEKQREAVQATEGPLLIIAGPGSGKTRTLTHRIAYLIASEKARPYEILALTFTNKAAREMQERISRLVEKNAQQIWMGTFHSIFARLLRREADKLGFTSDFSIYDTDDTERVLRGLMTRYHIDSKQFRPRAMRSLISSAKNQMVTPQEYQKLANGVGQEKAAQLYGPYQQALRRANALDFDDLLIKPIELFRQDQETLRRYQQRWKYVHIDEYQDTNRAQYLLAKMLSGQHKNLCVVGDDAQSIYAFRGADITNILSFQRDYKDATTIRLEQNYRSTKNILRLADSIIKNNDKQLDKELWTDNTEGESIVLMEAVSEKDEAQKIERVIRDLRARESLAYQDFAILYRTNAQSRSLEDAMRRAGIPYRVIGGLSFYQRKEIKDVMAYLRLVVNPDDAACLRRVINYPTRGIGQKTQERLFTFAREESISLWEAVERVDEVDTLSSRAKNAVGRFHELVAKYVGEAEEKPADEVAQQLIEETGILKEFKKDQTPENLMRWENVQELISAIAEFTKGDGQQRTMSTFLQEVALMTDQDEEPENRNRVTLMTLHASKGLEFPVVFIAGLEEGLFPLSAATEDKSDLEEERRLFYVGATRAEKHLYLSYARSRFRYGEQKSCVRSRFLEEVDAEVIRTEAGGSVDQRTDRFSAGSGDSPSYKDMDPHYYRQDLSKERGKRKTRRTTSTSSSGRRVVYDEGQGEIVPGAKVEHDRFGEGKVLSLEGKGTKAKATVFFKEVGQKKLALRFANLRRVK